MASGTELDIVIKAIDEASDQLKQIAANAGDSMNQVADSSARATESNASLTESVFKGVAAWDLLKEGIHSAKEFIESSIDEYAHASETMAMVKTNVENAGLSYEKLGPQIEEAAAAALKLGFQNDQTASSISKLLLITGDYDQALALNHLAMDLARNKGIGLEQATTSLAQVIQGAGGRALMQYGLSFKEGASAAEVLTELQDKLKGSTEAFAGSTGGQLEVMRTQWTELKEKVGEQFAPIVSDLFKKFEEHLPEITSLVDYLGQAFQVAYDLIEPPISAIMSLIEGTIDLMDKLTGATNAVSHANFKLSEEEANLAIQISTSTQAVNDLGASLSTASTIAIAPAAKNTDKLTTALTDTSSALAHVGNNTAKANMEMGKHSEAVKKLQEQYGKLRESANTDLADIKDQFVSKMKSISDAISQTTEEILKLTTSYNQSRTDETQSVADKIAESERKIADIKKQISRATTSDEVQRLSEELAAEQKNYDSSLDFRQKHLDEMTKAEARASQTDLQRTIEDYTKKQQLEAKDYQDKLLSLQNKLKAEKEEQAQEVLLAAEKVAKIAKIMVVANVEFKKFSDERLNQTTKEVQQEISLFQELQSAISATKSASISAVSTINMPTLPHFASGGVVTSPTVALIGEAGPEAVVPLSGLGSSAGGGSSVGAFGGITISINGGQFYTDRQSVTDFADQLAKIIGRNLKLRNYS